MRLGKDEDGQALVVAALSITLLLGFLALAVDVGILFRAKRNVQIAADAAAMAAALVYKYNVNATALAESAGLAAATANGYTNGSNGVAVTVVPPTSGPNANCSSCFAATVAVPNPTFFMSMFGFGSINVAAQAVAGRPWENCVFALGAAGVTNAGGTISLTNCGLIDNGSFANTGAFKANAVSIAGIVSGNPSTPAPQVGIAPSGDPLNLTAPTIPSGCGTALNLATSGTAGPGCYSGLTITNTGTVITLSPGLYVINNQNNTPISLGANTTLAGSGVTIYFNGALTIDPTATMNLSAPATGIWNGILFYEDPSDANTFALQGASGPNGSNLQGIFYTPGATVDLSNAGNMQLYAVFVANALNNAPTGGSNTVTVQDYLSQNPTAPLSLRTIALLE